MSWEKKKDKRT